METINNISEECFAGKSRVELITLLESLLEREPIDSLRRTVEAIKVAFYRAEPIEEIEAQQEVEEQLKALIAEYRQRRDAHLAEQDQLKELNLRTKLQIIEELKELTESDETLDHTFVKFRELQERWRNTGQVPVQNIRDIWERYHLHTDNFYSVIKINNELRDLDLKKNLEAKTTLCEAAEALLAEENPIEAFQHLQPLHDQWRETGPVSQEQKEVIWLRFKEASSIINKRHLNHFEALKEEQSENLKRKEALCERVESLIATPCTSHKEWSEANNTILEIQKEWKSIGFAPKQENTAIYNRLRTACDTFFAAKRDFYAEAKGEMELNLERKRAICEAAEALSQSEEWQKTSAELIKLQTEWKEIGAVSRRHSDAVWKRFRAACDKFFERKSAQFAGKESSQNDNLALKEAILKEMEEAAKSGISDIEQIKALQRRWSDVGFVPIKQKDRLAESYKEMVNKMFDSLRGGERERHMGAFRERAGSLKGNDRDKLTTRLKQLNADIIQLENNIGFFSRSKGAEAMIAEVERKIEKVRRDIADTKEKIKIIDQAARANA